MAKHREFDREVTVYVWRFLHIRHVGHAAVKLRGSTMAENAYVSWWPEDEDAKKGTPGYQQREFHSSYKQDMQTEISSRTQERLENETYQPRTRQEQLRDGTYQTRGQRRVTIDGEDVWGKDADEKIKLPGLGAAGVHFGLDLARMAEWWSLFKIYPHGKFKMVSKHSNCSGVAAAALKVGGAEQFAKAPGAIFSLDPNQIAKWARQIRAEIDARNEDAKRMAMFLAESGEYAPETITEVMSFADWTTLSNKNMGGLHLRSEKIKQIDRLLRQYHALVWGDRDANLQKIQVLRDLMAPIHHHLGHKPGSKRGDAVLKLGKQVLETLKLKTRQNFTTIWA